MIPDFLRIPQDARRAAWAAAPPRPMPVFADVTSRPSDISVEEFKRLAEEERRVASLNRIARMKNKMASKKVDPETHRWNAQRNKWEPLVTLNTSVRLTTISEGKGRDKVSKVVAVPVARKSGGVTVKEACLDLVTKDNAERLAKRNGVWKDSYGTLQAGLMTMTVKNALKRLVKGGHAIMWD